MEHLNQLTREEMRNVKGGNGPECFKCCYDDYDSICSECVRRWNPKCSSGTHVHSCTCDIVTST